MPSTISAINRLPEAEKREIYRRLVPTELLERFHIPPGLRDGATHDLFCLQGASGDPDTELALRHRPDAEDPLMYGHITDTLMGQIHVLLYVLNDPASPRFDVDRLPDGTATQYGSLHRNLEAETAALEFGLAPGQIRRGLRGLASAIVAFEKFVTSLGHSLYFVEPLYYHNAVLFEHYGFTYQQGRKLMERIQSGFALQGDLLPRLDNSTPFRRTEADQRIRLRSWAIHDGLLGEPFRDVTMYKRVGKQAGICTCPGCTW